MAVLVLSTSMRQRSADDAISVEPSSTAFLLFL